MAVKGVWRDENKGARLKERREVYPSAQIPHLWAHGLPSGRTIRNGGSNNFYATGSTIYSYGAHFPIARRVEIRDGNRLPGSSVKVGNGGKLLPGTVPVPSFVVCYLMNPGRYSVTTGSHIQAVRAAIPFGTKVYHVPPRFNDRRLWDELMERKGSGVAEYFAERLEESARAAVAPRIRAETKARHLRDIERTLEEWRSIHGAFRLRCSVDAVSAPTNLDEVRAFVASKDESIKRAEKRAEIAQKRAAEIAQKRAKEREDIALRFVDQWREGTFSYHTTLSDERITIRDVPYPVLRIVNPSGMAAGSNLPPNPAAVVETSHGAEVPVSSARRALELLPRLLERIGTDEGADASATLGSYRGMSCVREGLRIGCHLIPYREVRAFCRFYGWPVPANLPE